MELNRFTTLDIKPENVIIRESDILRLLGYPTTDADPFIRHTVQLCIEQSIGLLMPKAGYILLEISKKKTKEGIVRFDGTTLEVGKLIAAQMKKAEYAAIFTVTIGKEVETLSEDAFRKKDMLEGYIFNLIGSEAAESVAEIVHQHVRKLSEDKGLHITNRFSPGYCHWDTKEQFKIFSFFPDDFDDVTLTESALMNPVKSVSAIVGIGKEAEFKDYTCNQCGLDNCLYRSLKENR
ncbi:MAG: vitamin B12 dependent-methionine synthase activation domain-containing protein [Bacteroidota bacterium]|nr:vitamin B12 dependent-methionine synthase activation domain-containing protein [Bacteroidota bacterium]